jgi:ribonuclease HI
MFQSVIRFSRASEASSSPGSRWSNETHGLAAYGQLALAKRCGTNPVKKVQIITDGACLGNPGAGGWAAILRYGPHRKEIFGCEPHTTNNRMELRAAIEGLRTLREECEVEVITDSEYLKNGITSWIANWKKRNWMTAQKKPVINRDLWEELDREVERHHAQWSWTKGHASHEDNNRADELASRAAREQLSSP